MIYMGTYWLISSGVHICVLHYEHCIFLDFLKYMYASCLYIVSSRYYMCIYDCSIIHSWPPIRSAPMVMDR